MMKTAVMDLPICFIFATMLLIAVQAGPADQGPQTFTENKPAKPATPAATEQKPKQHKRAPQYEMQMKEVILYLTPSQIRALESGQGLPKQESVNQPQPSYEQIKDEMQNVLNEQGQKLQKQVDDLETTRKQKMQSKETPDKNLPKKTKEQKKISPEHNAPQAPQSELQKREKFVHLPLQFELIPQLQYQNLQPQLIHPVPAGVPQQEQQVYEQQPPEAEPQSEGVPQNNESLPPQNYAYLYFYPEHKPVDQGKLEFFYPNQLKENPKQLLVQPEQAPKDLAIQSEQQPKEVSAEPEQSPKQFQSEYLSKDLVFQPGQLHKELLQLQQEQIPKPLFIQPNHLPKPLFDLSAHSPEQFIFQPHDPVLPFHHKYRFVPYEYGYANNREAQQILQAHLENHELQPPRPKKPSAEPEPVEEDAQDILERKELEAQYQQINKARKIEAQVEAQERNKLVQQFQASLEKPQVPKSSLEYLPQQEEVKDIEELKVLHKKQLLEVIEARKLKAQLQAQEQEAHRLDAQLEAEQLKAEKMKEEQQQLEFLSELEPRRTRMYSILKPLFQGHNIAESLEEKKASFPHHKISLEKGFKPLQYAPKYNADKYAKEVEKILRKNQLEKEKAYAKAAAIANEPPEIITSEDVGVVTKQHNAGLVKHVKLPVPTPVYVPVPEPFEVKIPQPYPVPLEIIRPIPIPIVKMEKVEVEKPVPVEVEKHVAVPITKNVYVKVDKPYYVEKVVPVEVKKEIPVEIPIHKHQKLSIIRHVWER